VLQKKKHTFVVSVVAFYNSVFLWWLLLREPKYRLLYWHESQCTCRPTIT